MDEHFPLRSGAGCEGAEKRRKTPQELTAAEMGEGEETLRPGEEYRMWNAGDVMGGVPGDYATVLERGARWVGVGEEYLERVLYGYEKRVARRQSRNRERTRDLD